MSTINTPKRGRPSININWPDSVFTVKDVQASAGSVSGVAIQLKINMAIKAGLIAKVGKLKSSSGRPSNTYRLVKPSDVAPQSQVETDF